MYSNYEIVPGVPLKNLEAVDIAHPDTKQEKLFIEPCGGPIGQILSDIRKSIKNRIEKHSKFYINFLLLLAGILIGGYISFMIANFINKGSHIDWCYGYGRAFLYIVAILWCITYYKGLKPFFYPAFKRFSKCISHVKNIRYMKHAIHSAFAIAFIVFIIYDTSNNRRRLISLLGVIFFLLISFIFSKHPEYVRWDTVLSGVTLQILFGLCTIRWETGRNILKCFGDNVVNFLNFGLDGATFVYGHKLINEEMVFAFQALSTLYFLAMFTRILFYLGWLQVFCFKIGSLIEMCLGTTVIESVNAVTIIFLGMSEAPLLYSVYLADLSSSELHAIMASGFSTVAGTLLAAYTSLGVDPRYVITASIMAAPASLCFAKLLYPETIQSKTTSKEITLLNSKETSLLQAASNGASSAIGMVQGIIASVVACVAFISFLNAVCSWLATLVGYEGITLEYLVGILFVPIAWLMGVDPEECQTVGSLIGIKTVANEFIAYMQLGALKKVGKLSARSEAIATFALCAFSNPSALGSSIAILTSLEKSQSEKINKVALRAFITGCITTFTSASIAGLLTE
nr:sodium/nucleoside cotransporter 1-like [Halyomorpha halys]